MIKSIISILLLLTLVFSQVPNPNPFDEYLYELAPDAADRVKFL